MKQLLLKRKGKFALYVFACLFPIITDLLRTGVFALFFKAIEDKDKGLFINVIILAGIFTIVSFVFFVTSRMMRISYMRDTILDVRTNAFDKILSTSYNHFNKKSKDVYISNLVNDINNFETNFFINLLNFIYRGGLYVASIIILLFLDLYLALSVLGISLIIFLISKGFEKKTAILQKQVSNDSEDFTINTSNVFNGLEILKLNNINLFRDIMENHYKCNGEVIVEKEILVQDSDGYLLRFSQTKKQLDNNNL